MLIMFGHYGYCDEHFIESRFRDCFGFQIADGKIASDDGGRPMIADLFTDPAFDMARRESLDYVSMLRRMGEFEPARLGIGEMEYTTLPHVLERLEKRFKPF